jgi:preprotein translocase subunit SecG
METIVIVVHLLVALGIIGLILMQQGKGAEAGASFGGGASQTVFGSQGGSNFFAKATAILAFVFFATSFSLAIIAKEKTSINVVDGIPAIVEQAAVESEIPVVPAQETTEKTLESELPPVVKEAVNDSVPAK